ncbi:hypothetical protein ACWDBW_38470 [Streptomyces sp. NPDC001107]
MLSERMRSRLRALIGEGAAARVIEPLLAEHRRAQRDIRWQMMRILLILRVIYGLPWALTLPGIAGHVTHPGGAFVLLLALAAESLWFMLHLIRNHQRAAALDRKVRASVYDTPAAVVEVCSAVAALWSCALVLGPDRVDNMAPLLVLTTEQVVGLAIGSAFGQPLTWLVAGAALIAGSYAGVVALGDPAELSRSDALVGLTGYVLLAYLIRRGALFLLRLRDDVSDLQQRQAIAVELHNHLGNTLREVLQADLTDPEAVRRMRHAVEVGRRRIDTYISTGHFSEPAPLIRMVREQVDQARQEELTVELNLTERAEAAETGILPAEIEPVARALRAVLINVSRHAKVAEALLHVDVLSQAGGAETVVLVVADHGDGFPPHVLREGAASTRSLARHQRELREHGGDLRVVSEHGVTQVTLVLPLQTTADGRET